MWFLVCDVLWAAFPDTARRARWPHWLKNDDIHFLRKSLALRLVCSSTDRYRREAGLTDKIRTDGLKGIAR